jgi:hypothetical protein
MKISAALRLPIQILLSALFALSSNAQACKENYGEIPTETIDISDLKPGSSKIVVWGYLPVAAIKKPNNNKILETTISQTSTIATTPNSLECFVGKNGRKTSATPPKELSVLILLTPTGCSPKIIMEPSKAPTPESRSIIESSGGVIYDTCTGRMFDLDGIAIEKNSLNMLTPTHTVIENRKVVLGKPAN